MFFNLSIIIENYWDYRIQTWQPTLTILWITIVTVSIFCWNSSNFEYNVKFSTNRFDSLFSDTKFYLSLIVSCQKQNRTFWHQMTSNRIKCSNPFTTFGEKGRMTPKIKSLCLIFHFQIGINCPITFSCFIMLTYILPVF